MKTTTETCMAVNCSCPWENARTISCTQPAIARYELRPGVLIPVCATAVRQLPEQKLRSL